MHCCGTIVHCRSFLQIFFNNMYLLSLQMVVVVTSVAATMYIMNVMNADNDNLRAPGNLVFQSERE